MNFNSINKIAVHANCPDGMASAILLKHALPKAEVVFIQHGTAEYLNFPAEPGMIFCDIFPPEGRLQEFADVGTIVLDHHKEFKNHVHLFGNNGVFADEVDEPDVSGASLAYREVWAPLSKNRDPIVAAKQFAELAAIRDTWQVASKNWEKSCFQASVLTFLPWSHWEERLKDPHFYFNFEEEMKLGETLFYNRLLRAKALAKKAIRFSAGNKKVAIFNDPDKLTSDVSEILRNEGIDLIAGFFFSNEDNIPVLYVSLRSNGDIDVAEIAACFPGGGGHTASAGFSKAVSLLDANPFTFLIDQFQDYVLNGPEYLKKSLELS